MQCTFQHAKLALGNKQNMPAVLPSAVNVCAQRPQSELLCMGVFRTYLPGLRSALSRMSGLLVPASTTTPAVVWKPSISTSSWFKVFSLSSLPPANPPRPRARPIASISSAGASKSGQIRVVFTVSQDSECFKQSVRQNPTTVVVTNNWRQKFSSIVH